MTKKQYKRAQAYRIGYIDGYYAKGFRESRRTDPDYARGYTAGRTDYRDGEPAEHKK